MCIEVCKGQRYFQMFVQLPEKIKFKSWHQKGQKENTNNVLIFKEQHESNIFSIYLKLGIDR